MKAARAFAPATVANVACAFDVVGFALDQPGDEVVARAVAKPGVRLVAVKGDKGVLPRDAETNVAGIAASLLLRKEKPGFGVELELSKGLGIGTGLGSSSASIVASLLAVNALLEQPLPRAELVQFAIEGERAACGSAHADNVAPALLGGFVLIRSYNPLDLVPLRYPRCLCCAVVCPDLEVKTSDARRILKRQIPLAQAVTQWGNIGGLVAGLLNSDLALIGRSLTDVIVEPERAILIPGFYEAKSAALHEGALGCSISGAGPSLFALCSSPDTASNAVREMKKVFNESGIEALGFHSLVNPEGGRVEAA